MRRAREAERRQLTVLVCGCDAFESEPYLALDSEAQADLLRHFSNVREAVQQFDGHDSSEPAKRAWWRALGSRSRTKTPPDAPHGRGPRHPRGHEARRRPAPNSRRAASGSMGRDAYRGRRRRGEGGRGRRWWARPATWPSASKTWSSPVGTSVPEATTACSRDGFSAPHWAGNIRIKLPGSVELFRVERVAVARSPIDGWPRLALSPLTGRDRGSRPARGALGIRRARAWARSFCSIGEPGLGKSRLVHTMKQHRAGTDDGR